MFINKNAFILAILAVAVCVSANAYKVFSDRDEEISRAAFQAARQRYRTFLDKDARREIQQEENTGKHNSNKEILFGDEYGGDLANAKTKASVNNPDKKVKIDKSDDDAGAEASGELHERLERSQRTDKSLNKHYHAVKAKYDDFHRAHANEFNDRLELDLEQALLEELSKLDLNDAELVSDAMNAKEMQPNGSQKPSGRLFLNANGMAPSEAAVGNKNEEIKPVSITNLKENLIGEREYNKNLQVPFGKDEDDPFSDNEFLDILGLTIESLKDTHQNLKSAVENRHNFGGGLFAHNYKHIGEPIIAEEPSMAMKQAHENNPYFNDKLDHIKKQNDYLFIFIIAGCTLAAVVALVAAGTCWVHRNATASASNVEFGGVKEAIFGSSGSIKSKSSNSSGDRRLAQSAQMYHYQHQKQQMIAMEKANNDTKPDNSDNSEGETEEGDYTVYECPGLAPTGEMEVKNPLFKEDITQSSNPPEYKSVVSADAAAKLLTDEPMVKSEEEIAKSISEQLKPSEEGSK